MRIRTSWVLAVALLCATPAAAHCNKTAAQLLKYMLHLAPSNFGTINAGAIRAGDWQYRLTPEAESFCPNTFILENYAGSWFVKFDFGQTGAEGDVLLSVIKKFTPVLKEAGFRSKPTLSEGKDGAHRLDWQGPSNLWVRAEAFWYLNDENEPTKAGCEIKVGHTVT